MNALSEYKGYKLERGLWYAPYGADVAYIRIFTVGGSNRIAEISNYPRAYRDTANHVYGRDTEFIVTRDDYNTPEDDAYYDERTEVYYHEGDKATHWAGDGLPGAFPRWLEYSALQPVVDFSAVKFPLNAVPKPIKLKAATVVNEANSLSDKSVAELTSQLSRDEFSFPAVSVERHLIYFHYERRFK